MKKPRRPLSKRIFVVAMIPLLFELSFMALLFFLLHHAEAERAAEKHAAVLVGQVNRCIADIIGTSMYFIIFELTNDQKPRQEAITSAALLDEDTAQLQRLSANDDALVREDIAVFTQKALTNAHTITQYEDMAGASGPGEFSQLMKRAFGSHDDLGLGSMSFKSMRFVIKSRGENHEITKLGRKIADDQLAIRAERSAAESALREQIDNVLRIGVAVSFLISVCLAIAFNLSIARRIRLVADNTRRFAAGEELREPLQGEDEIAALDQTFAALLAQLKESRRREGAVINQAADVICTLSADGRVLTMNPACEKLWGYPSADTIGHCFDSMLSEEQQSQLKHNLSAATTHGAASFELAVNRLAGPVCQTLWSATYLPQDEVTICTIHDITERHQMERLKREFSTILRQDLQSPLSAMKVILNDIQPGARRHISDKAQHKLQTAEQETERLLSLVAELSNVWQPKPIASQSRLQAVSSQSIIKKALAATDELSAARQIKVVAAPVLAVSFAGVEADLVRVLVNLLSNAIRFSPAGGSVIVSCIENNRGRALDFRVQDEGPGIPAAEQSAIFQKYRQAAAADAAAGTGLGLAICKQLVEAHGGTLSVSCPAGGGSIFCFSIPTVDVPEQTIETADGVFLDS